MCQKRTEKNGKEKSGSRKVRIAACVLWVLLVGTAVPALAGAAAAAEVHIKIGETYLLPCLEEVWSDQKYEIAIEDGRVLEKDGSGRAVIAAHEGSTGVTVRITNPGQEFYYRIVVEAAGIASADSEEGTAADTGGNVPGTEKIPEADQTAGTGQPSDVNRPSGDMQEGGSGQTEVTDQTSEAGETGGSGQTEATDQAPEAGETGGSGQTEATDQAPEAGEASETGQTAGTDQTSKTSTLTEDASAPTEGLSISEEGKAKPPKGIIFSHGTSYRDHVVPDGYTLLVSLESGGEIRILYVLINGKPAEYNFLGGDIRINSSTAEKGKTTIVISAADASGQVWNMAPWVLYRE